MHRGTSDHKMDTSVSTQRQNSRTAATTTKVGSRETAATHQQEQRPQARNKGLLLSHRPPPRAPAVTLAAAARDTREGLEPARQTGQHNNGMNTYASESE